VCPWNQHQAQPNPDPELQARPWILEASSETLLGWGEQQWDQALRASALRRIKPWMWRRNLRAAKQASPKNGPQENT
jgi:epoxyqueuosine reductase